MLSSTLNPKKSRDCWYVRASPSRARRRAGMNVTSLPKSSTEPVVATRSPAITLNSVVFPAPFGPRIARRSPGVTARLTSQSASRPPKRRPTPRRRRVGSALVSAGAAVNRFLLDDLACDDPVLHDLDLPVPRQVVPHARRLTTAGRRARLLEQAAERLIDVWHEAGEGQGRLATCSL